MSGLGIALGVTNLLAAGLVVALARPLVRRRVKPNPWYGARFRRSFESDELWYAINAYAGRLLIAWSGVLAAIAVGSFFAPVEEHPWLAIVLGSAALVYLIPAWQAWRYAQRL